MAYDNDTLLLETGDDLLQETGSLIILERSVPVLIVTETTTKAGGRAKRRLPIFKLEERKVDHNIVVEKVLLNSMLKGGL